MAARKIKLAHPGKILREEFMEPVGLSAYALAKALGVPLPRVNDIVREKRSISPEMAVLLSAYFGTSDGYWISLQAHFDLEMAKDKVGKQAARISPHPHGSDFVAARLRVALVHRRNGLSTLLVDRSRASYPNPVGSVASPASAPTIMNSLCEESGEPLGA
jgi:addiction module HigA family antidote